MADTQSTAGAQLMTGNLVDMNAMLVTTVRQQFTAAFHLADQGRTRKAPRGWPENGCSEQHPFAEHNDVLDDPRHLGRLQPD